jgi:hypothetical protein
MSVIQSSCSHTGDAFQLARASFRLYCVRNNYVQSVKLGPPQCSAGNVPDSRQRQAQCSAVQCGRQCNADAMVPSDGSVIHWHPQDCSQVLLPKTLHANANAQDPATDMASLPIWIFFTKSSHGFTVITCIMGCLALQIHDTSHLEIGQVISHHQQ